jgi:nucleotide-binding universal stress UspA family protein
MNKQMRLLVAYDGSEFADEALQDLKRAGLTDDGIVRVLSVADVIVPPPLDPEESFPQVVPQAVKVALARSQQKLGEATEMASRAAAQIKEMLPRWDVSHEGVADSPAWAIVQRADEWKPDLIVMGARGHSDFGGRLILGSVSQRVLYEATCSVRISRVTPPQGEGVRVLIGVDNSADSKAVVEAVCNRNWPQGSEVALVAVVDTVMAIPGDSSDDVKWIEVSQEEHWDQVRALFEPEAVKLREHGLHAEVLIRRGGPADQIIQEAHSWDADVIFLGAKGTRGIDRLLLGSVSSAVASQAHCSVEVVRTAK